MRTDNRKTVQEVGARLKELRGRLNYSRNEIANRLGITANAFGKNENGNTLPGIPTLRRLSGDLNVSMDWLFFNRGPMVYHEKLSEKEAFSEKEKKAPRIEEVMPDVRELLDHMEKDPLLRHKVLLDFYKYKKENEKPEEPPVTESDS